jgi:hypothetical protein
MEAAYIGLYTTLVTTIALSGGRMTDARFRRILQRFLIDKNMPTLNHSNNMEGTEDTDVVLSRLIKQGYLIKAIDENDETVNWYVGPRGKMEVGDEAILNLIKTVYRGSYEDMDENLRAYVNALEPEEDESEPEAAESEEEEPEPVAGPSRVTERTSISPPRTRRRTRY